MRRECSRKYISRKLTFGTPSCEALSIRPVSQLPRSTFCISAMSKLLPNMNQPDSMLRPPESTSRSAPAASRAWAVTMPSSTVAPPGTPSATLILAITAIRSPTAALTRASTWAGKRTRLRALPPNSSLRRLERGEMNWLSR